MKLSNKILLIACISLFSLTAVTVIASRLFLTHEIKKRILLRDDLSPGQR